MFCSLRRGLSISHRRSLQAAKLITQAMTQLYVVIPSERMNSGTPMRLEGTGNFTMIWDEKSKEQKLT